MSSDINYPTTQIGPFEEFQNSVLNICINILNSYKVLLDFIPVNLDDLKKYQNKLDHGKKKTKGISIIIKELSMNVNKKWLTNKQLINAILSIKKLYRKFFSSDVFQNDFIYYFALLEEDILQFVDPKTQNKIIMLILKNIHKIKNCFSDKLINKKKLSFFSNLGSMHSLCSCEDDDDDEENDENDENDEDVNVGENDLTESSNIRNLLLTNNTIKIYETYLEYKKMFEIVKKQFFDVNTFLINIYLLSVFENNKEVNGLFKSNNNDTEDYIINSGDFLRACEMNNQSLIETLLSRRNISLNYFYCNRNIFPLEYLFISCKNKTLIENILKNPAFNINAKDGHGRSIVHKMYNADLENPITKLILTQPYADYNLQDNYGDTLLMLSIEMDNQNLTKFLLEQPFIKINLTNIYGENALALAIEYKRKDIIESLLNCKDIDINCTDNNGVSILMKAIKYSISKDIIKRLIDDPDIDLTVVDHKGKNLLFYIINFNCTGIIDYLIKKGVDLNINHCLITRESPINMAIKYADKEIIQEILSVPNLDINKIDERGRTPLMAAIENENLESVKLLLKDENLIVNKNDRFKRIPLNYAVGHNLLNIVELLINHKDILINNKDIEGKTSLICASLNDNVKIIKLLLEKKADINIQDNYNYTALMYTIENNFYKSFNTLISVEGINLNLINDNKQNALHLAVTTDNIGMVKKIVENPSTDVNFIGNDYKTALLLAVNSKYCNDLADELLVRKDIDINIKDAYNNTALSLSIELNKPSLTKKILQFINSKAASNTETENN